MRMFTKHPTTHCQALQVPAQFRAPEPRKDVLRDVYRRQNLPSSVSKQQSSFKARFDARASFRHAQLPVKSGAADQFRDSTSRLVCWWGGKHRLPTSGEWPVATRTGQSEQVARASAALSWTAHQSSRGGAQSQLPGAKMHGDMSVPAYGCFEVFQGKARKKPGSSGHRSES